MADPSKLIRGGKGAKAVMSLADQVRAEMAAEKAATRARGFGVAGEDYADPKVKPTMKFSEALGNTGSEGKTLNLTEADRSRVQGENMGGVGFSGLQLYSKPHRDANVSWGFGSEEIAKRKSKNADPEKNVFTTYIGSPDQHKSNSIVVRDALKNVQAANNQNLIDPAQINLINKRIREARSKSGTLLFQSDFDVTDPQAMSAATTFDRRTAISNALMGIGVQGPMKKLDFKKANPNLEYKDPAQMDSILRRETEPMLEGLPNYSVGPRLFTLDGGVVYRPDLNFAFPHQTTGTDMGVMFEMPTIREAAPDFIKKKGYKPKDVVNARAMSMGAPTQFVSEEYLTNLQKIGRKKGGLASMAKGGAARGIKKLKGIYNEVETSMGRGKGADFEQTASPLNIIKETGGNWSPSGEMVYKSNLDRELEKLEKGRFNPKSNNIKLMLEDAVKAGDARQVEVLTTNLRSAIGNEAANKWVQSNLKNYITKQMATKDDPVRKLAEEGITAFPKNVDEYGDVELRTYGSAKARQNRKDTGYVQAGVSQSPLAKHYETMTDESISPNIAKEYQRMQNLPPMQRPAGVIDSPWLLKLDPETPIFSLSRDADFDKLGFGHMMDVLREDVAAGRIRPEKLNTISIEQAVRRTHEYDETLKANMLNARIAEQANANVFKEYPEGYKWVQLDQPGQFALESDIMGHSVRGYEPPKGHPDYTDISGDSGYESYGHGGYEAIKSGDAKVYSLRDPKGQSHVTVEVGQNGLREQFFKLPQKEKERINSTYKGWESKLGREPTPEEHDSQLYKIMSEMGYAPTEKITQIKGKQNAAPNESYQPYVQDFVKSGNWSDVGDLDNTGLVRIYAESELAQTLGKKGLPVPKYASQDEVSELLKQAEVGSYRDASKGKTWINDEHPDYKTDAPPAEGMAKGGLAYMGKGGAAKGAKKIMSLADQVRAEMAAEKQYGQISGMVSKVGEEGRSPIIPVPNRWFLQPDKFPNQQKLIERVLQQTGMRREDFPSGAFIDPRTGDVLDSRIMDDLGVVINPATNRPMMSAKGQSGLEVLDPKTGSYTKSNLVRKGLFKPEGGDPILNDMSFIATIEKGDVGHKYGLATEYASPTELFNTNTGANPTLRPRSRGDLFGVGDVVGQVRIGKSNPHDVYEKLFVAPKGSDVQGKKLSKAKGGLALTLQRKAA